MKKKSFVLLALSFVLALGGTLGTTADAKKAKMKSIPLADSRQVVTVSLKSTDENALTQYAYGTVNPSSADFHQYLSPTQFATKFGQPDSYVADFKTYMAKYHVKANPFPDNLAIKLTGTIGNLNKAFKARLANSSLQSSTKYRLPGKLSNQVVAVVGLYAIDQSKKTTKKPAAKLTSQAQAASNPTQAAIKKPNTALSPANFSEEYGAMKFANT